MALAKQIIRLTTKEGDLICDPFFGSGTFALAAVETGRHFLAIEADPAVFEKFRGRICLQSFGQSG